jgi:hypothetical protein
MSLATEAFLNAMAVTKHEWGPAALTTILDKI